MEKPGDWPQSEEYGSLCEDLRVLCVKLPRLNAEDAEVSAEAPSQQIEVYALLREWLRAG